MDLDGAVTVRCHCIKKFEFRHRPAVMSNRIPLAAETWRVRQPSIIKQVPKPSHSRGLSTIRLVAYHAILLQRMKRSLRSLATPKSHGPSRLCEHTRELDTRAGKERNGRRRRHTFWWEFVGMGHWHDGDYSSSQDQSKSSPLVPGCPSEHDLRSIIHLLSLRTLSLYVGSSLLPTPRRQILH